MKSDHRSKFSNLSNWKEELTSLPMCGFIAQLVEHRTGIAEVTGSNPVEALIFFGLLLSNCLNWKIYCDDHSSLHLLPQYKYELFHIYFTLHFVLDSPICQWCIPFCLVLKPLLIILYSVLVNRD